MIRKAIIVVLTLGAAGTAAACVTSCFQVRLYRSDYLGYVDCLTKTCEALSTVHAELAQGRLYCEKMTWPIADLPVENTLIPPDGAATTGWSLTHGKHGPSPIGRRALDNTSSRWIPAGFRLRAPGGQGLSFVLPLWLVFVLFATCPTIVFIRGPLRRWRRRKRGECVACGHNLTGSVSGVCPECGGVI